MRINAEVRRRRCLRFRVGEADNGHHRDRRHPGLLTVLGRIIEPERVRSILTAARGVTTDLKTAAVGGKSGKVSVAGAARLASLAGIARQSARRRCKFDDDENSEEQGCRNGHR